MKKLYIRISVIITLLLIGLCIFSNQTSAMVADYNQNLDEIYAKPIVDPEGYVFITKTDLGFAEGSYDWHENDDWDWDTLASEYGFVNKNNGDRKLYLMQAGGKYHPSFEFWVRANSITGNSGFLYNVDFTNLENPTEIKVKLRVSTSERGDIGDVSKLTKNEQTAGTKAYYYDYQASNWISVTNDKEGYTSLPDGYRGYVYSPMSAYATLNDNGVGKASCFVQMYHLDFSVADNTESTSPIYFDGIEMVTLGNYHEHTYSENMVFEASCSHDGLTLSKCSCGQVKWDEVTRKTRHNLGEKYACSDKLVAALCSGCNSLIYLDEICDNQLTNGVKITYNYNVSDTPSQTRVYPHGYTLKAHDIPYEHYVTKGIDGWQFFRFTTDDKQLDGLNPLGLTVTEDLTLNAQYNIASYDGEKFRAMNSIVSFNGGPYANEEHYGKVIFSGHSNFSLWHSMENWYANKGITVLNNSVAGSSSHNYNEYIEELVLMYKPKVFVTILSSNDLAYHNMTDAQLMKNMKKVVERVKEVSPETKIIILAMNPLPGRSEYYTTISRVNKKVENYCDETENLYFVDIFDAMLEYSVNYPIGWDTSTHLHQDELSTIVGDMVYEVLKELV